jgi:type IV secretion system protein VirD4
LSTALGQAILNSKLRDRWRRLADGERAMLEDVMGRSVSLIIFLATFAAFVWAFHYRADPLQEGFVKFGREYLRTNWIASSVVVVLWLLYGLLGGWLGLFGLFFLRKGGKPDDSAKEWLGDAAREHVEWTNGQGGFDAQRIATINQTFDRKDKTLSVADAMDNHGRPVSVAEAMDYKKKTGGLARIRVSRNLAAMDTREREFLRVVELLSVGLGGAQNPKFEEWCTWARLGLLWGDGKGMVDKCDAWGLDSGAGDAPTLMNWYIGKRQASVSSVVSEVLRKVDDPEITRGRPDLVPLLSDIRGRLKGGNAWLSVDEVAATPFAPKGSAQLKIGVLDGTNQPLTYSGEGSLITIAPPGSGKTQCHVFPNLLTWVGPAVVLDVKGEIYAGTSKWRAQNVGPVYKFSPLDPANSHCYNPLSFIRHETDYIWEDSRFLADMMIVPSGASDPFWESRARDVMNAAIAYVCYSNPPSQRAMQKVLDIIHGGQPWDEMVLGLQTAVDVRSMVQQGTSLAAMNEKTRDSVLQTAQSSLSAWSGERINRVTQRSDWSPLDLRGSTHPTIYICLKPSEVESYTSLLRVFIAQHIRMLTSELPPPGSQPILFLLDELPRLRHMPPVEEAIEIGRQYGLRLWMFAQSLGQLEKAYPNAEGMIGSCAVRIFMNPSAHDGTAEKVSDELGYRNSALDGSRQKIVEPTDLAGPEYRDCQIVIAASSKPAKVKKAFAWQDAEISARMGSL